jgi:hypothetical protein
LHANTFGLRAVTRSGAPPEPRAHGGGGLGPRSPLSGSSVQVRESGASSREVAEPQSFDTHTGRRGAEHFGLCQVDELAGPLVPLQPNSPHDLVGCRVDDVPPSGDMPMPASPLVGGIFLIRSRALTERTSSFSLYSLEPSGSTSIRWALSEPTSITCSMLPVPASISSITPLFSHTQYSCACGPHRSPCGARYG